MVRKIWRVLRWVLLALLIIVIGLALWIGPMAYRAMYPSDHHDVTAPSVPANFDKPAILVFSKTNGFRHDDAIIAANKMFDDLAAKNGWSVYKTENGAVHSTELLSRFQAVVWSNVSGNVLDDDQRAALRDYIEQGGGFVGIHAAGDSSHEKWQWYMDDVIGTTFIGHTTFPQFPKAEISIEATNHPVVAGLPAKWNRTEEWYSFDKSVRSKGFRILATVDEGSYELSDDLRMGKDHPIIWSHCAGKGRVVYSALGHAGESFAEPNVLLLSANAVKWAMGREPCDPAQGD